jgi:hypothetical protein
MFQNDENDNILSDFPKFELSYETMTHKKVFDYNVILAIPDGQKCFAWFTTYKEDNVCFIMDINTDNRNQITNIRIGLTGFKNKLAFGTIFYGTIFNVNGAQGSGALIIAPHSYTALTDPSIRISYSNGTVVTGLLTASNGVTTGNSAKITTKCSTATRYGEINTNSDGNTMFNIISEIIGNGYFFMYNTSTELLRVNPTEITASKVINANAGVNAGSTTIQTTGSVSGGTGIFSGLLTANAGVKIPTGLQLFLSADGNNYITNNSTNVKMP